MKDCTFIIDKRGDFLYVVNFLEADYAHRRRFVITTPKWKGKLRIYVSSIIFGCTDDNY